MSILKRKNCTLYLNTNGTFLFNYPDLIPAFEEITYHCSENLDIDVPMFTHSEFSNIDYMIIVHDENINKLRDFLDVHLDIKFSIVESTYNKAGDGPTLSRENKHMIMTRYSNRMTRASIKRMIHEKDFNSIIYI